jgi:hypothetical protein
VGGGVGALVCLFPLTPYPSPPKRGRGEKKVAQGTPRSIRTSTPSAGFAVRLLITTR